ncbi:hypothetical protein [Sphingobium sp.]|uniref:hypothetical protein n=1 Tax=Sphingobium sp. TaxID=1912891 RepID=UPI003BB7F640
MSPRASAPPPPLHEAGAEGNGPSSLFRSEMFRARRARDGAAKVPAMPWAWIVLLGAVLFAEIGGLSAIILVQFDVGFEAVAGPRMAKPEDRAAPAPAPLPRNP